jgi:RNA polymerase-binding transcription factor DksA
MENVEKIDPRWNWHRKTLLELRENLIRKRDEHRLEASAPIEPDDVDPADRSNDETEREGLRAEINAEDAELAEVEAALQRLRDGTYGICVRTGKRIAAARLRAMPWTPYSLAAAEGLKGGE